MKIWIHCHLACLLEALLCRGFFPSKPKQKPQSLGDGCHQLGLLHRTGDSANPFGRLGLSSATGLCHQHYDAEWIWMFC